MTDVAEIARGLTKAQREALDNVAAAPWSIQHGLNCYGLVRESRHIFGAKVVLTKLGKAVRAHLTQEQPQ